MERDFSGPRLSWVLYVRQCTAAAYCDAGSLDVGVGDDRCLAVKWAAGGRDASVSSGASHTSFETVDGTHHILDSEKAI